MARVENIGGIMVNVWDSTEELHRRQAQGKEYARRLKLDAKWTNRVVQLAQSISYTHWSLVKKLPRMKLQDIIEQMMRTGFPGDEPYEKSIVYLKDGMPTEAGAVKASPGARKMHHDVH